MSYNKKKVFKQLGGDPSTLPATNTNPSLLASDKGSPVENAESLEENLSAVTNVGASSSDVQKLAKLDLDFLGALLMPLVFAFRFPPIFKDGVWPWLVSYESKPRSFPQLALGLPRGFAKSTLMKLFLVYCILYTKRRFLLIVAANASLAENILSDVIDMLEEPNVKATFGDWKAGIEKDTQSLKKFGFRGRNIILATVGATGQVRGLLIKNQRPDVMLFDDIQSRECADSKIQSDALEHWLVGTAMKAKAPTGCMFLFVGNMYPTKHSILRKLKFNPTWYKFITGGIQADGSSLWEELQPIAQLYAEYERDLAIGHPEIFYAEVLNDENASSNNLIDLSLLPAYPYQDDDIPVGNYIIIDPATDKIGSDAVSVGYFEVHNAMPTLMEVDEGRFSPGETIRKALKLALANNCRLIAIEANAYQYSLLYWFTFICAQLGVEGLECVPIYSGSRAKNTRIIEMFLSYAKGEFYIHPDAKLAVHTQISQFNPLRTDNTDGLLDLLTYAPRVLQEFGEFIVIQNIVSAQEYTAIDINIDIPNSGF